MIDLIILAAQLPLYIAAWRVIFKKIAYYYVKEQRKGYPPQLEPDWGDIGYGIIGATLCACLWPLMALYVVAGVIGSKTLSYANEKTSPMEVAEKLGGKAPPEIRLAYLDNRIKTLEAATGMAAGMLPDIPEPKPGEVLKGEIC